METDRNHVEFSIVMPCLNEVKTLKTCIEKAKRFFHQAGIAGEIVVADNGSTDGSQAVAEACGARVVPVTAKGYGHALRAGIERSCGKYVIMGDSDDSYDFSDLTGFVTQLRAGFDLVMGNRFAGGIRPGAMPGLHRYLGNPVLSFLGRVLFHIPVGDFHCGLRGFSRKCYDRLRLKSGGMEFASELVIRAALEKATVCEVPVVLYPDGRDRPPHLRSWSDGWRHLRLLLKTYFSARKTRKQEKTRSSRLSRFASLFILFFFLLLLAFKLFIGELAYISSDSMMPTLSTGDWIWYDKYSYGAVLPRRLLDIPVVNLICLVPGMVKNDVARNWSYRRLPGPERPDRMDIVIFKQESNVSRLWVKRIIGMPGDTVSIRRGIVSINGAPVKENGRRFHSYDDFGPVVVEPDHYFVLGDYRSNSFDSRKFGTIAYEQIVGKTRRIVFTHSSNRHLFFRRFMQKVK